MKSLARNLSALTVLFTSGHGVADVIYSGLKNITIPTTYAGVNIDVDGVDGWDLNPFLGGVYLSNSAAFQPGRSGIGGLDRVLNFATGATISASGLNFATGSGGALDHLGTQFTAGQEGYLGFRLNNTHYGWMRVVFTNNDAGAKVLDWAYEDGGAAIQTGNVLQSGSVVTLNSAFGSFTLGSPITEGNSVIKTGANTTTLSGTNTYTGATTVTAGTLIINGSTSSTSLLSVGVNGTLGGTGTVGGHTTISGTHNPGNSPGVQTFTGNLSYVDAGTPDPTVNWELNGNTSTNLANPNAIFDQVIVGGNLDFTNITTINLIFNGAGSGVLWSNVFWDAAQSWTLYDVAGTTSNFANLNLNAINWLDSGGNLFSTTGGSFSLGQSGQDVVLNYTVVPESRAALLGGLGMLLLLRRRR